MKKILFITLMLCLSLVAHAQKDSAIKFKPYGFVSNYICYDTRECVTVFGEIFNIMPKDVEFNADGSEDLNSNDKLTFVSFATRLGLDVAGPEIWKAKSSAKVEADFCGYGVNNTLFRIRQAYLAFDWERLKLICGQTWHPMVNQVMPTVVGLSTGAPFAAFNRSPQVKIIADMGKGWDFTAAALYQFPNTSVGPVGADACYSRWSMLPELYVSMKHVGEHFTIGVGVDALSIMPRKTSFVDRAVTLDDGTTQMQSVEVSVNDRVTGISPEIFADYKNGKFNIKGKVIYAQNTAHLIMASGFGATDFDPQTGSYKYAPIRSASSWLNATYGQKWRAGLFLGYTKNLGAAEDFISTNDFWMRGAKNTDYIYRISPSVTYNYKSLQLGLELDHTAVGYGDIALNGSCQALRNIANTRACLMVKYSF